jgi:uncharacterized protein (TIGR01244 family)
MSTNPKTGKDLAMADIRQVTDSFAVAPQLGPEAMSEAAERGFTLVINNRPDGEAPDQPTSREMEAAARAAGLDYVQIPFAGRPSPDVAQAVCTLAEDAEGPVLAFCRSGTRSITAWSIGQAMTGKRSREELLSLAAAAGYDLSAVLG